MKALLIRTALASSLLLGGATAFAQDNNAGSDAQETCKGKHGKKERRAKFESMTPEERQAHFEARKAKRAERLAKMTPEQRAKFEARREARKAKRDAGRKS